MKISLSFCAAIGLLTACSARADYQDVHNFFNNLNHSTLFPVQGRGLADVESAFGPRIQTSGGNYDWHRGIDIDGTLNTDLVISPLAGYLHRYSWESTAAGYTVILRHELSDFGVPSLTFGGKTITRFFTWYSHLYDDGINGNNIGTGDLYMNTVSPGDAIAKGQTIGILGSSGTPANGGTYGPHLHFELRVGSNASLQYQLEHLDSTQWGFDPHINPMVLFDPTTFANAAALTYQQSLNQVGTTTQGQDVRIRYANNADELPLLNRVEIGLYNASNDELIKSHVLDYDQRTGYNATTTQLLDYRDPSVPHIDPIAFGDSAEQFQTDLVVPVDWLVGYESEDYEVGVSFSDIYGSSTNLDVQLIPEPSGVGLLVLAATLLSRFVPALRRGTRRRIFPGT